MALGLLDYMRNGRFLAREAYRRAGEQVEKEIGRYKSVGEI